jgi:hypothetical protein
MAHGKKGDSRGEFLQIIILTLAMTGGGFGLLYLGLKFWMIPKVAQRVKNEDGDYEKLTKLLASQEMIDLRENAKEQEETNRADSLAAIIDEEIKLKNLSLTSRVQGRPSPKGNIIGQSQTLKIDVAPMRDIVEFVARVRHAKKSVRIETFNMKRATRSRNAAVEDAWTATVQIVEFKPKPKA